MISLKKLIAIAIKWRNLVAIGRKTISIPRACPQLANKGHFVVYSTDRKRFVVPLVYLHSNIFRELFRMSEEVFGLPRDGPITLPCDSELMEYVLSIFQKCISKEMEKAFLMSFASSQSCPATSSVSQGLNCLHITILEGV